MAVDWLQVIGSWQTDSIATVGLLLELASAALYLYGVSRVRRSGRAWPVPRVVCFLAGLASVAFVLQSGLADYDDTVLWVHMSQHLVLMMVAAPLLALGAPVRLALAAGSRNVRRAVASVLHDPSMRMISGASAAVLLPLDYYGSMGGYILSPLYRASELHSGFHEFVHVYFLACGLMFWVPILAADPATWRPSYATKLRLLVAGFPAYAVLAVLMLLEGRWISPEHSTADVDRGALLMGVGGIGLTALGLALVLQRERLRRAGRPTGRQDIGRH